MSQSTKRKHVTKEVLDDFEPPKGNQKIVKVVAGRGNNLHQVQEADEKTSYLVFSQVGVIICTKSKKPTKKLHIWFFRRSG